MLAVIFFLILFALWGLTGSFVLAAVLTAVPLALYFALGNHLCGRSQQQHDAELARSYANALHNIRR